MGRRLRTWIITIWQHLRASYWFLPSVMALVAAGLSFVTTAIDRMLDLENPADWNPIYSGGADGARQLFATVAGSMITVAGVVFSLTMVTLTLASQQYGSRLLYNFMRDTGNQVVLGTFLSTYLFCLLALRTVRGGDENLFVPHVSVTVAVVLALASVCVLIYFIHHVASSISPATIIAAVGQELDNTIEALFPEEIGDSADGKTDMPLAAIAPLSNGWQQERRRSQLEAKHGGYVQYIDGESLMELASKRDLIVEMHKRPGSLVLETDILATVWWHKEPQKDDLESLRKAVVIGQDRTSSQDLIFPINQMVQLAQRALSPSINDPHTAMLCIDRLGRSLHKLLRRKIPTGLREDSDGELRVVTRPYLVDDAMRAAFPPIREYSQSSYEVIDRIVDTLEVLARSASNGELRNGLRTQLEEMRECIECGKTLCPSDRERLLVRTKRALAATEPRNP